MFVQLHREGRVFWIEVTGIQGEVCSCLPDIPCHERGNLYPIGMVMAVHGLDAADILAVKM